MDKFDKATRSHVMSKVRSKDTMPEKNVRSVAYSLGLRFRLHRKDLPGTPDLVFPKWRLAVFVHGCFWHGHDCPHGKQKPMTNVEFWQHKIGGNIRRDIEVQEALVKLGWHVLVIWECQVKTDAVANALANAIEVQKLSGFSHFQNC